MPLPLDLLDNANKKRRRFLIATGTARYEGASEYGQLPTVKKDIERISKFFTKNLRYRHVLTEELGCNPTCDDLRKHLGAWLTAPGRTSDDVVVLYYSGHGIAAEGSHRHYLIMQNSDVTNLATTAFRTEDIMIMLEDSSCKIVNFLLILDTCHSANAARNFSANMQTITEFRKSKDIAFHILTATFPEQEARPGFFTDALIEAIEKIGEERRFEDEFLTPASLVQYIRDKHRSQIPLDSVVGNIEPIFFPNPFYQAGRARDQKSVQESIRRMGDLDKVRCESLLVNFKGRDQELADICQQIEKLQVQGGYFVITGEAGRGKSSMIARLVRAYELDPGAFHFLPLNFDSDHKLRLLQKIMFFLSEKYELDTQYVFTEDYESLCSRFPRMLEDQISL